MFSRNCCLRALASGAGLELYWVYPLGVGLGGVEWNSLSAMVRRVRDSERETFAYRYIGEFADHQGPTRGAGRWIQRAKPPPPKSPRDYFR
jgi:hypothetical protein